MKYFIAVFLIGLSVGTVAQKPGEYQTRPFTGLSPADGKAYLDLMNYDEKSKFMYLILSDEANLYVDILLSDRAAIQRTMMFGLTSMNWLNPAGCGSRG